jgi:hypothetical protein
VVPEVRVGKGLAVGPDEQVLVEAGVVNAAQPAMRLRTMIGVHPATDAD